MLPHGARDPDRGPSRAGASAATDASPNAPIAAATASSKWFEVPVSPKGAALRCPPPAFPEESCQSSFDDAVAGRPPDEQTRCVPMVPDMVEPVIDCGDERHRAR